MAVGRESSGGRAGHHRMKPAHWAVAVLVLAPAWKLAEWAWGAPGPKAVSARAVELGGTLFRHEWTANDPLASGDGLGPVFNARSCVECHNQGGEGGGGPLDRNVTVFGFSDTRETPRPKRLPPSGVVHAKALRPQWQETLAQVSPGLPARPRFTLDEILKGSGTSVKGVQVSMRNTPALFGDGLIDAVPDDAIIAREREHSSAASLAGLNRARDGQVGGRVARLADGRVGRFGWKGEFASLNDFVKAACANELGLSNPGKPQPAPLGKPGHLGKGTDLTDEQCELMTDFIRALARPVEVVPSDPGERGQVEAGRGLFSSIGCADCHTPTLASASSIYSDLLLHDMGPGLESATGAYGEPPVEIVQFERDQRPNSAEWRTPPLWGVADSAPYMHDGRAGTLDEAIALHGGEARGVTKRFEDLSSTQQAALLAFLRSLRAPSAPSTTLASDLVADRNLVPTGHANR